MTEKIELTHKQLWEIVHEVDNLMFPRIVRNVKQGKASEDTLNIYIRNSKRPAIKEVIKKLNGIGIIVSVNPDDDNYLIIDMDNINYKDGRRFY